MRPSKVKRAAAAAPVQAPADPPDLFAQVREIQRVRQGEGAYDKPEDVSEKVEDLEFTVLSLERRLKTAHDAMDCPYRAKLIDSQCARRRLRSAIVAHADQMARDGDNQGAAKLLIMLEHENRP